MLGQAITAFSLQALLDQLAVEFEKEALQRANSRYKALRTVLAADVPDLVIGEPVVFMHRLGKLTRDATRRLDAAAVDGAVDAGVEAAIDVDASSAINAPAATPSGADLSALCLNVAIVERDEMSTRLAFTVRDDNAAEVLDWTLAVPARAYPISANENSEASSVQRLEGLRTLIVDDDLRTRRVLRDQCAIAGMAPVLARDGLSAKTAALMADQIHRPIELVLMASPLASGDAVDLLVRLSQRVHRTIPAVLLTSPLLQSALQARVSQATARGSRPLALVLSGRLTPASLLDICRQALEPGDANEEANNRPSQPPPKIEPTSLDLCARAGIDIVAGLASADGNDALYRRLLRMFRDTQRSFRQTFTAAAEKGDAATTKRLAHTLRGGSVSLGMTSLAASASHLERHLKAGLPLGDLATHIEIVLLEVELIVSALEHLGPNETTTSRPPR